MRILIAEAKTMTGCNGPVTPAAALAHTPALDAAATALMAEWSRWSAADIALTLKISPAMASDFLLMAREFPDKAHGSAAIEAFTGVVFKAFDYRSLNAAEKERVAGAVNIISSAYGWRRADDIIKRYRLDFTPRMAPDDLSMAAYWKPQATRLLIESMQAAAETEILDLLPADAAKCIDRAAVVKAGIHFCKVDFRTVSGTSLRTPHSTLLKTLRGRLLRDIIRHNITSLADVATFEGESMTAAPGSDPQQGTITFLTA